MNTSKNVGKATAGAATLTGLGIAGNRATANMVRGRNRQQAAVAAALLAAAAGAGAYYMSGVKEPGVSYG